MKVPGLRSPHVETCGIVYFARMLDKVRLHAQGKLPPDYHENLGQGFDLRCCLFLGVSYDALRDRALEGGEDVELLKWCFEHGRKPSQEQIEVWNEFMRKRGWNDTASERLRSRLAEIAASDRTDILTMFDFIDLDEGRDPAAK